MSRQFALDVPGDSVGYSSATMAERTKPQRMHSEERILRLTPEQETRVVDAARAAGKKVQDFLRDAAVIHADDVLGRVRDERERADARADEAFVPRRTRRPRGFVYQRRTDPTRSPVAPPVAPPSQAPTVIVNAGGSGPGASPQDVVVDFLLRYLQDREGGILDSERRTARVEEIIRAAAVDDREAEALATKLDERLGTDRSRRVFEEKPSLLSKITSFMR